MWGSEKLRLAAKEMKKKKITVSSHKITVLREWQVEGTHTRTSKYRAIWLKQNLS
jgi:hypothetical protein